MCGYMLVMYIHDLPDICIKLFLHTKQNKFSLKLYEFNIWVICSWVAKLGGILNELFIIEIYIYVCIDKDNLHIRCGQERHLESAEVSHSVQATSDDCNLD